MFHRIDDVESMPAPRFFALAYRITAYRGVVTMRMEDQVAAETPSAPISAASVAPRIPDASPQSIASAPDGIADLFSFGGPGV